MYGRNKDVYSSSDDTDSPVNVKDDQQGNRLALAGKDQLVERVVTKKRITFVTNVLAVIHTCH